MFEAFEKDYSVFTLEYMNNSFIIGDLIRSYDTEEKCVEWIKESNLSIVEHFVILPTYTKRRLNED